MVSVEDQSYVSLRHRNNLQPSDVEEKRNSDDKVKDPDAEHNYLGNFQGYKTESSRKLSNFNYQWTKTLYQNNLKNIAFFLLPLPPPPRPHTWYSLPPLEVLEFFSAIIMRSLLHLLLIYLSRYSLDFSGLLRSLFSIHRLLKLSLFCSCFHRLLPYTHHSTLFQIISIIRGYRGSIN